MKGLESNDTKKSVKAGNRGVGSEAAEKVGDPGHCRARRNYCAPVLTAFGDLRTLTLGGSAGIGDSGDSSMKALDGFPI